MAAPDLHRQTACAANLLWQAQTIRSWNKPRDVALLLLHLNPSQSTAANSSLRYSRCRGKCVIDLPHAPCPTKLTNPKAVCARTLREILFALMQFYLVLSWNRQPSAGKGSGEGGWGIHWASCSERFDWPLKLHVSKEGAAQPFNCCATWRMSNVQDVASWQGECEVSFMSNQDVLQS